MVAQISGDNNFFIPPVSSAGGVEGVGYGGGTRKVNGGGLGTPGYNPFSAISAIDCELHPDVGAQGSHHLNGVGFGTHTINIVG